MKTTSYDISKKLAEIGFKAETEKVVFRNEDKVENSHINKFPESYEKHYKSYDLETILDILPKTIERDNPFYLEFRKEFGGVMRMGYSEQNGLCDAVYPHLLHRKGESLADCAARLLILLHGRQLIKFEG